MKPLPKLSTILLVEIHQTTYSKGEFEMAFYEATSKINSITKSITDFLEKVPMKEWDEDSKAYRAWNFSRTEVEHDYDESEGKIFWVNSSKSHIYIKISKDYELVMRLTWDILNLKQTLKVCKIYVREDTNDWDEEEYPSYFEAYVTDDAANSGMSSVLTDLERAVRMKKDDWKRKEI